MPFTPHFYSFVMKAYTQVQTNYRYQTQVPFRCLERSFGLQSFGQEVLDMKTQYYYAFISKNLMQTVNEKCAFDLVH